MDGRRENNDNNTANKQNKKYQRLRFDGCALINRQTIFSGEQEHSIL